MTLGEWNEHFQDVCFELVQSILLDPRLKSRPNVDLNRPKAPRVRNKILAGSVRWTKLPITCEALRTNLVLEQSPKPHCRIRLTQASDRASVSGNKVEAILRSVMTRREEKTKEEEVSKPHFNVMFS